jgi:hypothetical protein
MTVKTGATAQLKILISGVYTTIAKVRDVKLDLNRDALETTGIGQTDRTYVYGIRGTSGSGTLMFDSSDTGTRAVLNQALSDSEALTGIQLVLDTSVGAGTLTGDALLTAVGPGVSVGDLITIPISFTISGKPIGEF